MADVAKNRSPVELDSAHRAQLRGLSLEGLHGKHVWTYLLVLIDRRRKGLPVAPGHSFLFGHLLYLKKILDCLPRDAHYQLGFDNPEALAQLRAEHDKVLGPNPAAAATVIRENPRVLNSLRYTLAVIKESMRFFPPAGATRAGKPGINVTDDAGNLCPTDDAILWVLHIEMQTSEKYWVKPDAFLPERWLVPPDHELYPSPGAWRPFELGPRNCVAQALSLIELRIILACLVRTFEVVPAYDEWDASHSMKGSKHYRGERAYLVESGAAHPTAQYPCRVQLAQ
ncbi:predicted protein [Histoplasma mississippiense (nom. inval.)]|uniref:predicted protein n=1 Tax=Ajellomyces capsulatus (strain NAm1 / WU24) TaxID=2059318 RepID=UPI000157BB39|nr:predicted protein [Histoplasma mississippiense (nom. inval.)]EDN04175.1 predicted protein [Histoplasma mississippiense (nom. inval.)]